MGIGYRRVRKFMHLIRSRDYEKLIYYTGREHHKHSGVKLHSLIVGGRISELETRRLRPTCVRDTKSEKHECSGLTTRIQMYYYNYIL